MNASSFPKMYVISSNNLIRSYKNKHIHGTCSRVGGSFPKEADINQQWIDIRIRTRLKVRCESKGKRKFGGCWGYRISVYPNFIERKVSRDIDVYCFMKNS